MDTPVTERPQAEEPASMSIMNVLAQVRDGGLLADLRSAVMKVSAAVHETGKAGSIRIDLELKPAATVQGAIVLADKITPKIPEPTRRATLFFQNAAGELFRQHPKQRDIFAEKGE